MADLLGKAALVTGAQQGIGKAIALALAREGADVAINYLDGEAMAAEIAASVRAMGRRAELVPGDVAAVRHAGPAGGRDRRGVRQDRHHGEQRGRFPARGVF